MAEVTSPDYWVAHLRDTVRFQDGVGTLLQAARRGLVEVGPGRTLTSLAAGHPGRGFGHALITTMRHPQDDATDAECLARATGHLWCVGAAVQWPSLHDGPRRRVPLPTYPFEPTRHWATATADERRAATAAAPVASGLYHAPFWKQSIRPTPSSAATPPRRRVLLFMDQTGLGDGLRQRLATADDVCCVFPGEGFAVDQDGTYRIAPTQAEDYDRLLAGLGTPPDVVVHLWSVGAIRDLETSEARGFYSLLCLAQAIGNRAGASALALHVVSSNMHRVMAEASTPAKATLLGPCKVIPQEYPQVRCTSLDVDLDEVRSASDTVVGLLAAEIAAPPGDRVVAFRGGMRWTQEYEVVDLPAGGPAGARLVPGGTYLLTGGLGGIALEIADYLARQVKARLVLVSRSPFLDQASWPSWLAGHDDADPTSQRIVRLQRMQAAGAEILVRRADVTSLSDMETVWEEAARPTGRVDGVVHAAGLPGGGIAQLKSRDMAASVLDVKVRGTHVLDTLLQRTGGGFLFLCSSMSAVVGGVGHVDYCGANAFLDTFAEARRGSRGPHVVSADWNTWQGIGMASHVEIPEALRAWRDTIHDTGISAGEGYRGLRANSRERVVARRGLAPGRVGAGSRPVQLFAAGGGRPGG